MTILGDVASPSFLPWIRRHASKLGLRQAVLFSGRERVELDLQGAPETIDMMEMGCLLGPIEVWVEGIERTPLPIAPA